MESDNTNSYGHVLWLSAQIIC